jgi:hypothetical protein
MSGPRFRFTLGQLIAFVGSMAVLCSLLNTTYWPLTLAIAIVTPGFVLDRSHGGAGILGSMLAGILGFGGLGLAFYADSYFKRDASGLGHAGPGAWLTYIGLGGLIWGAIFGLCSWSVLFLLGLLNVLRPPKVESGGSAVRHGCGDRGLKSPRTGDPGW